MLKVLGFYIGAKSGYSTGEKIGFIFGYLMVLPLRLALLYTKTMLVELEAFLASRYIEVRASMTRLD